jgi:putative ABC transport system substrate-binding protein
MRRRELVTLIAGSALARPLAASAQQRAMPVIGFLSVASQNISGPAIAAFRQRLGDFGYVQGQNLGIEYRWAVGRYDRVSALAAELVGRKVAVILVNGGVVPALAAKRATSTIPIVFILGGDPVGAGVVASLARPGGNLTGVSFLTVELEPKRLQLLLELVPQAKVVALLANPQSSKSDFESRIMLIRCSERRRQRA